MATHWTDTFRVIIAASLTGSTLSVCAGFSVEVLHRPMEERDKTYIEIPPDLLGSDVKVWELQRALAVRIAQSSVCDLDQLGVWIRAERGIGDDAR